MKILRVVDDKVKVDHTLCYRSGTLIVHSLGTIEHTRDGFHSKQYITPPGFSSSRIFWSFTKPKTRTVYIMRIVRSQNNAAAYMVTAADAPTITFQGDNVNKLFNDINKRVLTINRNYFSHGDLSSVYPMARSKQNKMAFCLNGAQVSIHFLNGPPAITQTTFFNIHISSCHAQIVFWLRRGFHP